MLRRLHHPLFILLCAAILAATSARAEQPSDPSAPRPAPQVFLPMVGSGAGPSLDVRVVGIEVTQGVQNAAGTVPLVAGRPTVARVYTVTDTPESVAGVVVSVSGSRGGVALPGSPLRAGPLAVQPASLRGDYGASFNVALPPDWLSGAVSLTATVDSGNAVFETDEHNNSVSAALSFTPVPPLDVRIVPIMYTHAPDGRLYSAQPRDTIGGYVSRAFPVSAVRVSFRAPLAFAGDLRQGAEWERLLELVTSAKFSDGAPSGQVYYALVPAGSGGIRWFTTGVAGIGWIGLRAAVSLEFGPGEEERTGRIAAHEIGHTLRRYHAPCGTSGDPRQPFPYPGASIGPTTYGLDLGAGRVWRPGAPDNTRDLMSYCGPQWVSDFTYAGLMEEQRRSGAISTAPSAPGLLVRASLDGPGATLQPAYALSAPAQAPAAEAAYAVELLDAAGAVVARHPVEAFEAAVPHPPYFEQGDHAHPPAHADEARPLHAVHAVVPLPDGPVAGVRLVEAAGCGPQGVDCGSAGVTPLSAGGRVLAEMPLAAGGPKAAGSLRDVALTSADGSSVVVAWRPAEVPALVRFSPDGATWTTLAVDVVGGALRVDRAALPAPAGRFEITPAGGGAGLTVELGG